MTSFSIRACLRNKTADYKEEIERYGGKVVAAIFYGKTITLPHPLIVKAEVWQSYISHIIK